MEPQTWVAFESRLTYVSYHVVRGTGYQPDSEYFNMIENLEVGKGLRDHTAWIQLSEK